MVIQPSKNDARQKFNFFWSQNLILNYYLFICVLSSYASNLADLIKIIIGFAITNTFLKSAYGVVKIYSQLTQIGIYPKTCLLQKHSNEYIQVNKC